MKITTAGESPVYVGNKTITGTLTPQGQVLAANGTAAAPSISFVNNANSGLSWGSAANRLSFAAGGIEAMRLVAAGQLCLTPNLALGWGIETQDLSLVRDAAGILAQRNGTNAQASRLYNTYIDASNYERLETVWSANNCILRVVKAGTGAARPLYVQNLGPADIIFGATAGGQNWRFEGGTGHFLTMTDNVYDIGATGATRPRNVFVAGNVTIGDAAALIKSSVALNNGAAAGAGTLSNAPAAGNPTKWVPINDNGTVRYLPAW